MVANSPPPKKKLKFKQGILNKRSVNKWNCKFVVFQTVLGNFFFMGLFSHNQFTIFWQKNRFSQKTSSQPMKDLSENIRRFPTLMVGNAREWRGNLLIFLPVTTSPIEKDSDTDPSSRYSSGFNNDIYWISYNYDLFIKKDDRFGNIKLSSWT